MPASHAGVKCLLEDEIVTVGGTNHSHATQASGSAALGRIRCIGACCRAKLPRVAAAVHLATIAAAIQSTHA